MSALRGPKGTAALGLGAAVAMSAALLPAGCGGSSSPAVAHLGSGRDASSAGAQGAAGSPESSADIQQKLVAFARCMRANGVPSFPEPVEGRLIVKGPHLVGAPRQFRSAQNACRRLLPEGGRPSPQVQREMQERALRFAACMRSHGEPRFPEPEFTGNAVRLGGRIDPNSPQFEAAQKACLRYFPGGPKGGPGAGPPGAASAQGSAP